MDLQDTLVDEINVPKKDNSRFVSVVVMNILKKKGNLENKGFIYLEFQVTSSLLCGSQGRRAKHQMHSQK